MPTRRRRSTGCSRRRAKASACRKRSASPGSRAGRRAGCGCGCARSASAGATRRLTVWSLSDVTRERERQENVFQELQHAVDYLDHAPAGFFSVDGKGDVVYLNATLANWLDQDLAQVGSGGLKLADLVAGDGAALLTTLRAAPGEVKTEVLDLDLKTRSGRKLPVRLFHKLAFGADGTPGASRTLVLNRAQDDGTDPQRAAEIRFMRFFHNTPMAIATVDRRGGIVRTNPLFARLFHNALNLDRAAAARSAPSSPSAIAPRSRPRSPAAARGKGDIAPVEAALAGDGERFGSFYVTAVEEEERDQEAAIVYALETTAQRELENKVTQQQKMELVGQLAGGIAHDFNNVLSAIIMATDFLLNAHKPTDPSFEDIMQIKQNANRAASLVRHLLAFSRKQTLRPQVLDLGEVLSDLNMLLRRLIGEKVDARGRARPRSVAGEGRHFAVRAGDRQSRGQCARRHAGRRPAARAHRQCHGQGMRALSTPRACRPPTMCWSKCATPAPAFRTIDHRQDFRSVLLHQGSRQGHRARPVHRLRHHQTDRRLHLCRIPSSHEGTTFRIFLPRHIPGAEARGAGGRGRSAGDHRRRWSRPIRSSAPPARRRSAASVDLTGQGTILLVEDEEGLRALNARGLASRGYTVLEAGNGVEAIDVLEKSGKPVDLVVSDVVMPEMDGPTLRARIAQPQPGPENHLRVRLCGGRVPEEPARARPVRLPAEALHAQATRRRRKRNPGGLSFPSPARGVIFPLPLAGEDAERSDGG